MTEIPQRNTPEYRWWREGAKAENAALRKDMNKETEHIFDFVMTAAKQGWSADYTTEVTALVFTCDWPLKKRLKLAWRIIKTK